MEDPEAKLDKLGRQPDPEPPSYIVAPPPSILLYASLLIFALILLIAAFSLKPTDWAGFLINLSTEIVGAVIILLLVERRFRSNEIRLIRGLPTTTISVFSSWFSREGKELRAYAGVFSTQVESASLPFYVPRPQIEAALTSNSARGLVLIGPPGIGKSTLLHHLVRRQAKEVLDNPRTALVPILVPVRSWGSGEPVDLLRKTMQGFYPVSDRTFNRLLKKDRLMCLFDGVDELIQPQAFIEKLTKFHQLYPNNPLIISSRPLMNDMFDEFQLERIEIPSLTEDELQKLLKLRMRIRRDDAR